MKATAVPPMFKTLLEVAEAQKNRNLINMIAMEILAHCDKLVLKEPAEKLNTSMGAAK